MTGGGVGSRCRKTNRTDTGAIVYWFPAATKGDGVAAGHRGGYSTAERESM